MNRPQPPQHLVEIGDIPVYQFEAAIDVAEWARKQFIEANGQFYTGDHDHLESADIACLWTNAPHAKQGKMVVGTAEIFRTQDTGWKKERHLYWLLKALGRTELPDFLLTFDATFAAKADDASWCAVVYHELSHCAQAHKMGIPLFDKEGRPKWAIKGHDIEMFTGEVRHFGLGAVSPEVSQMVAYAADKPTFSPAQIAAGCGVCLRAV